MLISASVAFINAGKKLKILNKHCNNSKLLSEFFGPSCAPGAHDIAHNHKGFRDNDNLCSICPKTGHGAVSAVRPSFQNPLESTLTPLSMNHISLIRTAKALLELLTFIHFKLDVEVGITAKTDLENELDVLNNESKVNCYADRTNSHFGDLGALFCLQNAGDVAILGLKDINGLKSHILPLIYSKLICFMLNLIIKCSFCTSKFSEHVKTLGINPNDYRIICKNGSLADQMGFDVDSDCTLGSFIDSKILIF